MALDLLDCGISMAALAVRAIQVTALKITVRMKNREGDGIPLLSAIIHYRLTVNFEGVIYD